MNRSRRRMQENPKLQMTPMIDVVFQLLIFFIVAYDQQDILAGLQADRPTVPPIQQPPPEIEMMRIDVGNIGTGFSMGNRQVTLAEIDRSLAQVAGLDRTAPILIRCTSRSRHQKLVQVLDLCAKHDLQKISLFSM